MKRNANTDKLILVGILLTGAIALFREKCRAPTGAAVKLRSLAPLGLRSVGSLLLPSTHVGPVPRFTRAELDALLNEAGSTESERAALLGGYGGPGQGPLYPPPGGPLPLVECRAGWCSLRIETAPQARADSPFVASPGRRSAVPLALYGEESPNAGAR